MMKGFIGHGAAALTMCYLGVGYAASDVALTSDGKVPGTPFAALQAQIDNIELLPGPQGAPGESVVGESVAPGDLTCPEGGSKFTSADGMGGEIETYACNGTAGPAGADGAPGLDGSSCIATDNGDSTKTITCGDTSVILRDGEQGQQGEQGPPGEGQVINLTIDPTQFPGISAQDFTALFSDAELNTADLEVEGVCPGGLARVVVINGPAVEIQVIPGFDEQGRHFDRSGLTKLLPFVVEVLPNPGPYWEDCTDAMVQYFKDYALGLYDIPRALSLIVRDVAGAERLRWTLLEFAPAGYDPSFEGVRFTFYHAEPVDRQLAVRDPYALPESPSYNPTTDRHVEIPGWSDARPAVEEMTERTLTLVYDFVEGGRIWRWVEATREIGASEEHSDVKLSLAVIHYDNDGVTEIGRTNYYGCFPKKYENFRGFVQDVQTQERLLVTCDFSEDAH